MQGYEQLITEAMSGDKRAFEELYRRTNKGVYFTCMSFLKNDHDAKDVTQDVYMTVFSELSQVRDAKVFESWIGRITVNKCKDFLKKKKPVPLADEVLYPLVDSEVTELCLPADYVTDKAKRQIIMNIMREQLSDTLYQTVLMFYFHDMSADEIAKLMDCPVGTVTSRLCIARAKIKKGVEEYEEKNGDRLHSVALIPVLGAILRETAEASEPADIWADIALATSDINATAAASGGATASRAVNTGGKIMLSTLKSKILVAIIVAVLAVAAIVAVVVIAGNSDSKNDKSGENSSSTASLDSRPADSDNDSSSDKPSGGNSDSEGGEKPSGDKDSSDDSSKTQTVFKTVEEMVMESKIYCLSKETYSMKDVKVIDFFEKNRLNYLKDGSDEFTIYTIAFYSEAASNIALNGGIYFESDKTGENICELVNYEDYAFNGDSMYANCFITRVFAMGNDDLKKITIKTTYSDRVDGKSQDVTADLHFASDEVVGFGEVIKTFSAEECTKDEPWYIDWSFDKSRIFAVDDEYYVVVDSTRGGEVSSDDKNDMVANLFLSVAHLEGLDYKLDENENIKCELIVEKGSYTHEFEVLDYEFWDRIWSYKFNILLDDVLADCYAEGREPDVTDCNSKAEEFFRNADVTIRFYNTDGSCVDIKAIVN